MASNTHVFDFLWDALNTELALPPVNVFEKQNEYVCLFELAGYDKNDISLELKNNILKVQGTNNYLKPYDTDKCLRKEAVSKTFKREFKLPKDSDLDSISSTMENGILKVIINKITAAQPEIKNIPIL